MMKNICSNFMIDEIVVPTGLKNWDFHLFIYHWNVPPGLRLRLCGIKNHLSLISTGLFPFPMMITFAFGDNAISF